MERTAIAPASRETRPPIAVARSVPAAPAPLSRLKGGGPHFLDSQGSCWTAAYIQEGGNVVRDLRANISAEAGARQTYESLIKGMIIDRGYGKAKAEVSVANQGATLEEMLTAIWQAKHAAAAQDRAEGDQEG
jgi:hypothetical protein